VGWIYDIYIQGEQATIWIRAENGKVLKLMDDYFPNFYLLQKAKMMERHCATSSKIPPTYGISISKKNT